LFIGTFKKHVETLHCIASSYNDRKRRKTLENAEKLYKMLENVRTFYKYVSKCRKTLENAGNF
jgi:hypothetical protein